MLKEEKNVKGGEEFSNALYPASDPSAKGINTFTTGTWLRLII